MPQILNLQFFIFKSKILLRRLIWSGFMLRSRGVASLRTRTSAVSKSNQLYDVNDPHIKSISWKQVSIKMFWCPTAMIRYSFKWCWVCMNLNFNSFLQKACYIILWINFKKNQKPIQIVTNEVCFCSSAKWSKIELYALFAKDFIHRSILLNFRTLSKNRFNCNKNHQITLNIHTSLPLQ